MRIRFSVVLYALVSTVVVVRTADAPYAKLAEIHIGGAGGFDYLTVDPVAKRLYLSHGTEVVVIDTANNTVVGRITDTAGVHGIAVGPNGRLFTSNGRENKLSIVDAKTLATIGKVDTGANPDAIMYEPTLKQVWAFNHTGGSATVIDAVKGTVVATVPLEGAVEAGQADAVIGKVFVNIEDKDQVDVIDMASHMVTARWPIAPAEGGTGMAIDPAAHRIFVGGGKFVVAIDDQTGKVAASAPICKGTDATSYDLATKNLFVSCSDAHITVVHVDSPNKLSVVQTIDTARGARTNAVDPVTHRVYVASQEFEPAGVKAVPDSLRVLVYGTK